MAKEYTIKAVKGSGIKDTHGNEWFSVLFESGEQVSWLAKSQPQVGDTVYGTITEEEKKNKPGETYRRFRKEQRENYQTNQSNEIREDNDSMYRCNALNNAVASRKDGESVETTLSVADKYYEWLKGNQIVEKAKEIFSDDTPVPEPQGEVVDLDDNDINLDDIPF
jgi:hypothetical protein